MILLKKMTAFWVILATTVVFLSGCSAENQEKADLMQIAVAMKKTGFSQEKTKSIQERMLHAQDENEQRQLLSEMSGLFHQAAKELKDLNLLSEEGKSLQKKLSMGFENMGHLMDDSVKVDMKDQKAQLALAQRALETQQMMMLALSDAQALAKKHGIDIGVQPTQ